MKRFVTWGGATVVGIAGAAAAFFLDPKKGADRRQAAVERGSVMVRRERANVSAMISRTRRPSKRRTKGSALGGDDLVAIEVRGRIRDTHGAGVAEGVGVRVARGRVTLRGEVDDLELIGTVARTAADVDGVEDVNNLLRLGIRS